MRTLHLFAGIGAGMLSSRILGHDVVAAVEWDAFRCTVLRDRAADGWFPGLTVHECDVRDFDPSPYAGRVDCICAGFPCQDISRIGSGDGIAGARSGLWSEARRVIAHLRPAHVFLENGPDIIFRGADHVIGDLAGLGYDAQWGIVSAANAGAHHLRARWWCLANRVRDGLEGLNGGGAVVAANWRNRSPSGWPTPLRTDGRGSRRAGLGQAMNTGETLTDACRIHLGEPTGKVGNDPWVTVLPNPEFAGWLMRLPGGWSKPKSPPSETPKTRSLPRSHGDCSEGRDQ